MFRGSRKYKTRVDALTTVVAMKKLRAVKEEESDETFAQIILQILFPYLIAGMGMIAAGAVLDRVKQWDSFVDISEVFILIPSLLGLKGNLEMTLAARLSTQANLGVMETPREFWRLVSGNVALTLCQAIMVGFLASVLAVSFSWPQRGYIPTSHILLLTSSCMMTAFLSAVLLSSVMCTVVYASRSCSVNPDNIATPVAGSLGDLVAISILAGMFHFLYNHMDSHWLGWCIVLALGLSLPLWWYVSHENEYSQDALLNGWQPIIGAMAISSFGGVILDNTITHFDGLARLQPLVNGIGGNLVAIQISRLSTSLHRIGPMGTDVQFLSKEFTKTSLCQYSEYSRKKKTNKQIIDEFAGRVGHLWRHFERVKIFFHAPPTTGLGSKSARALLMLVVPGHLVFLLLAWFCHHDDDAFLAETKNPTFVAFYLAASLAQVATLLYVAQHLALWQWKSRLDPDTTCIPYLTAVGDLLGIILLASAFHLHKIFHRWSLAV